MLDERARTSSSSPNPELLGAPAFAATADSRDWVAEFRREQAHLIRSAATQNPSRLLPYGVGGALAVALAVALTTVLPARLPAPVAAGAPPEPAEARRPAESPAVELAEAREEGLSFDLARARQERQEAEAARTAHQREAEALRAAAAESEAARARAEAAQAAAETRRGALAHDLDEVRAELAAARRQVSEARADVEDGEGRSAQLAHQLAEADALVRAARAEGEATLAQALRERDEARLRLAEAARAAPNPAAPAQPGLAESPRSVDWTVFNLRLPAADIQPDAPPAGRDAQRAGSDRKAGSRARESVAGRSEPARRTAPSGRMKAGAGRAPTPPAPPGGIPELRLRGPSLSEPDA